MRLGYDAKRLFCNFTGLGNYSRTLLKNLAAYYSDNDYFLYTPKIKQNTETDFFVDNPAYQTYVSSALIKSLWRTYGMVSQLKKDDIELYHGLSHEIPVNIQKSNIKSVVTMHDLIFKVYPHTFPAFDRAMYDSKFKNSCINSDRIIAISQSTKNDIVKFYDINPDKIDVVYQSCAPLYYENEVSVEESQSLLKKLNLPSEYLLYVGSVEERKNLKVIINAYAHLSADFKIPLVVVGRGTKYKEEVLKLIAELGVEKHIIWLNNFASNNDLKTLYQNAQAMIYPSRYEGFGLPVAEALLCKTPAITTNISSLPEAGGPHSLYIDPDNAEELSVAIERVTSDTELRGRMIENGYKYAMDNFTSKVATDRTVQSYKKTLDL